MAQWDFCANVDVLVALAADGRGPRSMSEMLSAAERVVTRLRAEDPTALRQWLDDNASLLIAQQVLATSVHAQHAASDEMSALLRDWVYGRSATEAHGRSAVAWLREEHPAQLRAWLLSQVDELVESEITQLGVE